MEKIETKKFIALSVTITVCILSIIGFILGKDIPSNFTTMAVSIITFYFGFNKGENIK